MESGDQLTIKNIIIDEYGYIKFEPGDKVIIDEIFYTKGYWSKLCPDIYVKPKLSHFKIVGQSGHWLPSTFVEIT